MAVNSYINVSENKYAKNYTEEGSLCPKLFVKTYKATAKDGRAYAIKKVAINVENIGNCLKEIESLKKLDQNFIVPHLAYWIEDNYYDQQNHQNININFDYDSLYLPNFSHLLHVKMELYSLTLNGIIERLKSNYFDKSSNMLTPCGYFVASQLFKEIVDAVNYLHQQNPPVLHRNLKPENVMLTLDGIKSRNFVRLSDIGLESVCDQSYSNYQPTEVNNFRLFSPESDMYSLGVISCRLFIINFISIFPSHADLLQMRQNCLTNSIKSLISVCAEERLNCSAILKNSGFWLLSYDDIRDDETIKAIISETMPMTSNEENFISQYIRAKSGKLKEKNSLRKLVEKLINDKPKIPEDPPEDSTVKPLNYCHEEHYTLLHKSVSTNISHKQIFISYAHIDGSPQARSLKTWLNSFGYDAFLDIDDIKPGMNWRETLNDGIVNCTLFVPLVTPAYGTTKWTRLEIQLADQIDKEIIPVCFIDNWPSRKIAIILSPLHYIPWKTAAEMEESEVEGQRCDITRWEEKCVERTAKEIDKNFKEFNKLLHLASLDSSSTSSYTSTLSSKNYDDFIVFSCHPNQHEFANQLRIDLSEHGYYIWISSNDHVNNSAVTEKSSLESVASETLDKSLSSNTLLKKIDNNNNTFRYTLNNEDSNTMPEKEQNNEYKFIKKVNKASVVVLILSEDYSKSNTCIQQAFYCHQRIPIVAIKFDNYPLSYDLSKVCDEENILETVDNNFKSLAIDLKKKFEYFALMPKYKYSFNKFNVFEDRMYSLAEKFREQQQSVLFNENYILVCIASSGKSLNNSVISILKSIGKQLASLPMLKLLAGNRNSGEEILVNSFTNEKRTDSDVYHILPVGLKAENGQTLNVGESIKERDSVVSQLFKFCLLIDTGDEAIRMAQNFIWNDNFIIPAINEVNESKDESLMQLIKVMPNGVETSDWNTLFDSHQTADNIAIAIKNIITSLNIIT